MWMTLRYWKEVLNPRSYGYHETLVSISSNLKGVRFFFFFFSFRLQVECHSFLLNLKGVECNYPKFLLKK